MNSQEKPISGKLVTASDGTFVLVLDSPPNGKENTEITSRLTSHVGSAGKIHHTNPGVGVVKENDAVTKTNVNEKTGSVASHDGFTDSRSLTHHGGSITNQNRAVTEAVSATTTEAVSAKTVSASSQVRVIEKRKTSLTNPLTSHVKLVDGRKTFVKLIDGKKTYLINPSINSVSHPIVVTEANVRSRTGPVKTKLLNSPVIINCSTPTVAKVSSSAGLPNSTRSAAASKVNCTSSKLPSSTSLLQNSNTCYVPTTMPMIMVPSSRKDQPISSSVLSSLKQTFTDVQPMKHLSKNVIYCIPKSDTTTPGVETKQIVHSGSQTSSNEKEGTNIQIVYPSVADSARLLKECKVVTSTISEQTPICDSPSQCVTSNAVPSKLFSHTAAANMIPTTCLTTTISSQAPARCIPNNMNISMSHTGSKSLIMSNAGSVSLGMPQIGSASIIMPQTASTSLHISQRGSSSLDTPQMGSAPLVMLRTGSAPSVFIPQTGSSSFVMPLTSSRSLLMPQTGSSCFPVKTVSSKLSTKPQRICTPNSNTYFNTSNTTVCTAFQTAPIMHIPAVDSANITNSNVQNPVIMRMLADPDATELPPTVTITLPVSRPGPSLGTELQSVPTEQKLENGNELKVTSQTPLLVSSSARSTVSSLKTSDPKPNLHPVPQLSGRTVSKPSSANHTITSTTYTVPVETSPLKLKIDSVFSLSNRNKKSDKLDTTKTEVCARTLGSSAVKPSGSSFTTDSVVDKSLADILNPCYTVLEKLSEQQIAYLTSSALRNRAIAMRKLRKRDGPIGSKYDSDAVLERRCSSYCRQRTLNFLCGLGMLKCQKSKQKKTKTSGFDHSVPKHAKDDRDTNKTNVKNPPEQRKITSQVSVAGVSALASDIATSKNLLSNVTKGSLLHVGKVVKTTADPNKSGSVQLQLMFINNRLYLVPMSENTGTSKSVSSTTSDLGNMTSGPNSNISSLVANTLSQATMVAKPVNTTTSEKPQQINVHGAHKLVTTTALQQNISSTNTGVTFSRSNISAQSHMVPQPLVVYGPIPAGATRNRPTELAKLLHKPVSTNNPSALTTIHAQGQTSTVRVTPSAARTVSILKTPRPVEPRESSAVTRRPTETQTNSAVTQQPIESRAPKKTTLIIAPDVKKKLNISEKRIEPWKLPWNYEIKSEPVTEGYGDEDDTNKSSNENIAASGSVITNHPPSLSSAILGSAPNANSIDSIGNVRPTTYATQTHLPSKLAKTSETLLVGTSQRSRIERLKEILREKERMLDDLKRKNSFASVLSGNQ